MRRITILAIVFTTILFGTNFVFTKLVIPPFDAFGFLFARSAIGTLFLACIFTYQKKWEHFKAFFSQRRGELVLLGLVLYFGGNFGIYIGVPLTSASHVTILQQVNLFAVFLVNIVIFHRMPTRMLLIAALLNVMGAFLIFLPLDLGTNPLLLGDIIIGISVMISVGTSFKVNKIAKEAPPEFLSFVLAIFSMIGALSVMLGLLLFGTNVFIVFVSLSPLQWVIMAWLGVGITGVGYWLWSLLNKDSDILTEHASIIGNLTIIVGIVVSVLFLGDVLYWWQVIGVVFILLSVYLSQLKYAKSKLPKNDGNNGT